MPPQQALLSYSEVIFRLLLAAILGGFIGIEREKTSRFAGLRTHMLVCIGATLIMIVSQYGFQHVLSSQLVTLDPSRVAAQVVSGIGFLGAGTILFLKDKIRGLTTAASLWAVAGVGLAIGGGLYFAASIATTFIFIVLALLKPIENAIFRRQTQNELHFAINSKFSLVHLEKMLTSLKLRTQVKNLMIQIEGEKESVSLTLAHTTKKDLMKVIDELKNLPGIEKIEIQE